LLQFTRQILLLRVAKPSRCRHRLVRPCYRLSCLYHAIAPIVRYCLCDDAYCSFCINVCKCVVDNFCWRIQEQLLCFNKWCQSFFSARLFLFKNSIHLISQSINCSTKLDSSCCHFICGICISRYILKTP